MQLIVRQAWSAFVGLLILNVVLCGLWFLAIPLFPGLAPMDLGDLAPLAIGFALVPLIAVGALGAGLATRIVRPDIETGRSNRLDLLMRPAVAGGLVALVVTLFVVATGPVKWSEALDVVALVSVFFILFLAAAALLSLSTALFRRLTLRGITLIALALIGATAVSLLVMNSRGRSRLLAQQEAARVEVAAERKRQQERIRPVVVEPGVEGNAVDIYRALVSARSQYLQANPKLDMRELSAALQSPQTPPSPVVIEALEHARGDLEKLREATRARRVVWPIEFEKGVYYDRGYWLPTQMLALLALAEANQKANDGDVLGASEGYLSVLRFGSDFGDEPFSAALGASIENRALRAMARLVRSPRGLQALDVIETGLDRLEPGLLDVSTGLRNDRLLLAMTGPADDPGKLAAHLGVGSSDGIMGFIKPLLPWHSYQADFVDGLNVVFKEAEAVFAKRDPAAWQKYEDEFVSRHLLPNPNPFFRARVPFELREHVPVIDAWVLMDALQFAISLERRRAVDGRYPADPGPLPADLLARGGAALRYRAADDGSSYVLYSVGSDHKDDGGKASLDLLLPEAAWPSEEAKVGK